MSNKTNRKKNKVVNFKYKSVVVFYLILISIILFFLNGEKIRFNYFFILKKVFPSFMNGFYYSSFLFVFLCGGTIKIFGIYYMKVSCEKFTKFKCLLFKRVGLNVRSFNFFTMINIVWRWFSNYTCQGHVTSEDS